jgi:hypothetical protein
LLATGLFAATEPAWYNDVTSITANGQYYIYSVNGAGFMQAGNEQVKAINQNNYSTTSGLVFKIVSPSGGNVYSGNYYLYSYQASLTSACGPVYSNGSDKGTKIVWTLMENGAFWNIHSLYEFMGNRYAALYYTGEKYDAVVKDKNPISQNRKDTYTDIEYQWYVISPAHYDRHWAIYLYDRYKETISDYTKWENLVPAAYYTALTNAYAVTYNVKNTEHSKEVVNEHRADLKALYDNAAAVADAYANAKTVINALEAIEDKGEDFAEVTEGISNARTAIEQAMSVEALNAAVSAPALKAVDPITFNVTEFEAPNFVTNAASTVAGRAITYNAENKAIINAEGKAIHVGKTKLTATAAATDAYYKFVRSAEVTVTAPATYGTYEQTTCDESVTFFGKEYTESTKEDVKVGENWMGGDSIVRVNITINHATFSEESLTITYGDRASWNGAALSDSTVGVHTMVYVTTNAAGCDSTVTLTLTVKKQPTLNVPVELAFCEGGSETYRGVEYTEAGTYEIPAEGEIRDTLYTVKVAVNPVYSFSETGKAKVGEGYTWQGTNYETPATGTFKYEAPYTTVNGCDSIYYLTLTVTKADVVEVPVALSFCAGGSETFRGVEYTEANTYNVSAEGDIRDTLYIVNVTVLQPSYSTDTKTITFGDEAEWNGIALSDSTVGVHYVVYETTNAAGCDSTVTLTLTVEKMSAFEAEKELEFCEGDSVEYRGVWYSTAGEYPVLVEDDVRDTLINVIVTVHEKAYAELERTVLAGNVLTLPEGEWTIGDQVVIGTYETLRGDTLGLELYQYDETEFGCESVVKLIVTVTPNYEAIETVSVGEQAEKFFQNGAIYIRRGEKKYSVEGRLLK